MKSIPFRTEKKPFHSGEKPFTVKKYPLEAFFNLFCFVGRLTAKKYPVFFSVAFHCKKRPFHHKKNEARLWPAGQFWPVRFWPKLVLSVLAIFGQ